jgi:hypothetical protein
MVMQAPVWFLIARLDIFPGSTAFHRAALIDEAINHLSEWWLIGTKSTANWGQHLEDVTSQYIWQGVEGGVLTMILFILILIRCFRSVGYAAQAAEGDGARARQFCVWAMGASLFSHAITFMSVTYFDQNVVIWYMFLAMISSGTGSFLLQRQNG